MDAERTGSPQGRLFRFIRLWTTTIAVLVTAALLIQLWIAIREGAHPRAHAVGTLKGTYLVGRIVRLLCFFTIQSNILTAITSAQLARNPLRDGPVWRPVRLASLVGITVTGIVYSTVLAKVHEPHGWQEASTNIVVHYIAPIMMVVGWLAFGPRPRVTGRVVAYAAIFPVSLVDVHADSRGHNQLVSLSLHRRPHPRIRPGIAELGGGHRGHRSGHGAFLGG